MRLDEIMDEKSTPLVDKTQWESGIGQHIGARGMEETIIKVLIKKKIAYIFPHS